MVNGVDFATEAEANKKLELLVAYKYCREADK